MAGTEKQRKLLLHSVTEMQANKQISKYR